MKTIIVLFVLPFIIFSQTQNYPDSVYMKTGKKFPCLVTDIDDQHLSILYLNNYNITATLASIERLKLEDKGIIYESDKGFLQDYNRLKNFIYKRNLVLEGNKQNNIKMPGLQYDRGLLNSIADEDTSGTRRFSFGILYMPGYSSRLFYTAHPVYYLESSYYLAGVQETEDNSSVMQAQFSFIKSAQFHIILCASYRSRYFKQRSQVNYTDIINANNSSSEEENDLKIFDFTAGIKYYFAALIPQKVNMFIQVGIGKQITFADYKYDYASGSETRSDNFDDYLSKLNSPFHCNIGFGAEYSLNESFSVFSSVVFTYSRISAGNESRNNDYNFSHTDIFESWWIDTNAGIGVNFYF